MARSCPQAFGTRVLDFAPSSVSKDGVARARGLIAGNTFLRAGTSFPAPRHVREVVTFFPFLIVGLVPPFLPFFVEVLEAYAIHLVHLSPNTMMTLVIFTHACKMSIGVTPSVDLFRYFFQHCRSSPMASGPGAAAQSRTVGGCYLWTRQGRRESFFYFAVKGK